MEAEIQPKLPNLSSGHIHFYPSWTTYVEFCPYSLHHSSSLTCFLSLGALIWKEVRLRKLCRLPPFIQFVVSCKSAVALQSNLSSVICHRQHRRDSCL